VRKVLRDDLRLRARLQVRAPRRLLGMPIEHRRGPLRPGPHVASIEVTTLSSGWSLLHTEKVDRPKPSSKMILYWSFDISPRGLSLLRIRRNEHIVLRNLSGRRASVERFAAKLRAAVRGRSTASTALWVG